MIEILNNIKKNGELVGIRTIDQEIDEIVIGKINALNEQNITIEEVDEFGDWVGVTTYPLREILNIEFDDIYLRKISQLLNQSNLISDSNQVTIWGQADELKDHLDKLIKTKSFVTLYFDEDYYITGKIVNQSQDSIVFNNYTLLGDEDGFSVHFFDKLTGLRYNSKSELKIKLLSGSSK